LAKFQGKLPSASPSLPASSSPLTSPEAGPDVRANVRFEENNSIKNEMGIKWRKKEMRNQRNACSMVTQLNRIDEMSCQPGKK
jgi:hypothetical protein